jgi:hypothetical protein
MSDGEQTGMPDRARRAFEGHDAFEPAGADEAAYALTTTAFDARATAAPTDEWALRYTLTVRAPTLEAAAEEAVGPHLREGWFETYELRLADAPGAVRDDVTLDDLTVRTEGGEAVAEFVFTFGNADRAPAVAKAMAEYVEGTYVEGIVPGFTYRQPVSDLLSRARDAAGGDEGGNGSGPMPL